MQEKRVNFAKKLKFDWSRVFAPIKYLYIPLYRGNDT